MVPLSRCEGMWKDEPKIGDVVEFIDDGFPVPTAKSTGRRTIIDIVDVLSRLGEPIGDNPTRSYPDRISPFSR